MWSYRGDERIHLLRLHLRWKLFVGFLGFSIVLLLSLRTLLVRGANLLPGDSLPSGGRSVSVAILVSVAGSLFASFLIASRLNRPIRLLDEGIRDLSDGNLDTVLPKIRTFDEFEPLLDRFGGMVAGFRERASLERSLGSARNRLKNLSEKAPVALIQADEEGKVFFVNDRWREISGLTAPESHDDGWTRAIHPDDRERIVDAWASAVETGGEFAGEFRFRRSDGDVRTIRGAAWGWNDPASRTSGRFGVFFDLTLRRRLEEERERIFAMSLDLVCLAGADGSLREVNPAFEKLLGRSREEILARPFCDFLHPEDLVPTRRAVERLAAGHTVPLFENRAIAGDGTVRHFEWTAAPLVERRLFCAIGRDVTDRKKAEEAERSHLATRVQFELARQIHASLLPESPPRIPGFDIAAVTHAADTVGADYHDFLSLGEGRLGIVVGDAAGHGIGPALLMAQVRASLHSLVGGALGVEEILRRANGVLHAGSPDDRFVTLVLVDLDLVRRTVRHASCGHPTGWIFDRTGAVRARLSSTSLPLGCFREMDVLLGPEVALEEGDVLLLVTDGVLEAESPGKESFGEKRLLAVVRSHLAGPASGIVEALDEAIRQYSERALGEDDITSVVLKVLPREAA